ncbi:dipeptidase [Patulibacter defluvii]|uniref:dipeptidase n=1 Tax=Patulibacter defluvii TaxID=3095358 RepID=UPI002A7577FC|nr:membrane dipeptidase [Patulibacter sp. DM4]
MTIADAHVDLLSELHHRRAEERPFGRHWLGQLRAGGVALQVCPTFASDRELLPELALRRTLEQIGEWHRAAREQPGEVVRLRDQRDLRAVREQGRIGLLLAMEGAEALGVDAGLVGPLWELGLRMVGLTWNHRNAFADGAAESSDGGLSRRGVALVDRLLEQGIALDLAHASPRTFAQVLERAEGRPVLVSHAACRAVHDHERNLTDAQLEALAAAGGMLCLMALPFTIDPARPTVERLVDHVDHAVAVMGIEHVGLGGDFMHQLMVATGHVPPPGMGLPSDPEQAAIRGLRGPQDYAALVAALRARGYADGPLAAVTAENLFELVARTLPEEAP